MMKTQRVNKSIKGFLAAFVMFFAFMGVGQTLAQPSGYCTPWPPDPNVSWYYTYCYSQYYGYITSWDFIDQSTGASVGSVTSGDDYCYSFKTDVINLKIGRTYKVNLTGYMYYGMYGYTNSWRFFIDWNQNGTFNDATEYIGYTSQYSTSQTRTTSYTFTVSCATIPGLTRARALFGYDYYNPNSSDACNFGYKYLYDPYNYYYCYGEGEDIVLNFLPDIAGQFPVDGSILAINSTYSLATGNGFYAAMGSTQPAGTVLNMKVTGPKPATTTVWEGLDPSTGSPNISMGGYSRYDIRNARGAYAQTGGAFYGTRGGEYKLAITVSGSGCPGASYSSFTVSWDNDLSANEVTAPRSNAAPSFYKYPMGTPIPVTGVFQNVGRFDITEFWAYAYILNSANDTIGRFSKHWNTANGDATINPTGKATINFGNIRINTVGVYKVHLNCDLLSADDQEDYNDYIPRPGDPSYTFEVAYDIQLQAFEVLNPKQGQIVIGNRPVIPKGMFKNQGIYDASDVPARLNVYKMPAKSLVYTSPLIVQDIPAGKYNYKIEQFDVMTLRESGTYQAELIIAHEDDPVRSDDTTRITFTVEGGLSGTYTVGAGGNFPSIDSLMNTLYYRGLAGNCTFLLTDSYYRMTSGSRATDPAWDFTTSFINLGYNPQTNTTYTITFKPSQAKSLTKSSVVIDLVTASGKGIQFGQSLQPANPYSIYYEFGTIGSIARKYINFPGYVTFDGGSQKSLKFKVISSSRATANAFYLGRGTNNVTIKNVVIENGSTNLSCSNWMPMTSFNPTNGFGFQADTMLSGPTVYGYSAGIVNRSTLFSAEGSANGERAQQMRVDTIPNKFNVMTGNEIFGFGYGIVSLGMGQLLLENQGDYARFYNKSNEISNNTIYNICKAGIFAGYEEGTKITGNRIYNVSNANEMAAGILAGGFGTTNYKGYNNIQLEITANEISSVESGMGAMGIEVEQAQNTYQHPSKGQVTFPDVAEATKISNNAVWGLTTTTANAVRGGIHVLTQRGADLWTPANGAYNSRNDMVINNTVILGSNGSVSSTAPNAAIALQNVRGAVVKNNAIALTDMGVAAAAPVYSGLFYQGVMPANGGITSDYNVFYTPDGSGGTYSRFIETLSNGTNLDLGTKLDYETLGQWVAWTNADKNSVSGNFLADMEYLGSAPNQKLRVRTNLAPLGSLLNNRGQIISTVAADIDSETRGAAGQKYDIGHDEFTGRLYLSDVEAIRVTSPVAYRAGTGFFSDAEYIMTTAPIEVKGLIRNSGNLPQNSIACTLNIYRELPNGLYSTVPELTKIVIVAAQSGEFMDVAFGLADGIAPDFKPKTFGELRAAGEPYVPISEFTSMLPNVTPKYKIVIGIQADQFNQNNYMEKIVRFYIRKSDMRIVASVENSMVNLDINSTTDEIAGRLNADTLFKGFGKLGWKIDQANNRFDYDIFDRRGWEQKAVNYDMYRSLWWGDGNDKSLTRFQKGDLYDFLSMGNEIEKRNLIIGSQEMVRSNNDAYLTGEILRSTNVAPGNPMGVGGDNGNNSLMGVALHRNLVQDIDNTQYTGDAFSQAGLVAVSATGEGLARPTQYYVNNNQSMTNPVAGVATSTLSRNVIYMGVDWRHFAKIEYIVRASIDFIEKNGGTIIPVELTDFDARAIGQRVELNWRTASEYKSEKFEIERTVKSEAGMGIFTKISEMKAAGTSAMPLTYGPVVDRDVVLGQTYVYRLKMVDLDGNFDYSEKREVKVGGEDAAWLGEAVPNPVVNEASIEFSANGSTVVELYDITGKLVNILYNASANGFNKITINASQLTSGRYNVILKTADVTITKTINIVK